MKLLNLDLPCFLKGCQNQTSVCRLSNSGMWFVLCRDCYDLIEKCAEPFDLQPSINVRPCVINWKRYDQT